ncbi:MAG: integrase, partial [SAR324 cluster bacterium]|nr:integrase [SAR324 cluster bacterium]
MEIISAVEQIPETPNPEAGAVAVNQPSLPPNEALKLVFGEYAANTQRAYARAFRDLQEWADIRELREMEDFDPL